MRFTVVYEREPDGGYVVTVPALPGCVSQGGNREQVAANIREAIEATDTILVIAKITMTATDYANFTTADLAFVDIP